MSRRRYKKKLDPTPQEINITSIAHDGRGVGRDGEGKVVFVDYALPGERVMFSPQMRRQGHLFGTTTEVLEPSEHRVTPPCAVFGQCGGCVLQHLDPAQQIHYKQEHLLENLKKIGHVSPQTVLPPLTGDPWSYRRRARLGAKFVPKKGGMIVGFRERNSSFIQPISECRVLQEGVSNLLIPLRECLSQLSCESDLPQVEISVAMNATALVLRHLAPFTQDDLDCLTAFAREQSVQLFLQPGKLNSVHPLYPKEPEPLYYTFAQHNVKIEFLPTDFIQVNAAINNVLVDLAVELMDLNDQDRVLDLFSGIGNFTLPIARQAHTVVGVEGDPSLVARADHNRKINAIDNVEFHFGDLFKEDMDATSHGAWLTQDFNKVLIDPPRSGAAEMIRRMVQFRPEKIVYVSCGPATLARDAGMLVNEQGYTLTKAGVIDMFPHTAHVESIAVFERSAG